MMQRSTVFSMILLGAATAVGVPAYAQQPAGAAQPAPAAPPATSPTTAGTSPATVTQTPHATTAPPADAKPPKDLLRKARESGYHTRVKKGQTVFCRKQAQLGTRFETEQCLDEEQLTMSLQRAEAQRDQLRNVTCGGGPACGAGK